MSSDITFLHLRSDSQVNGQEPEQKGGPRKRSGSEGATQKVYEKNVPAAVPTRAELTRELIRDRRLVELAKDIQESKEVRAKLDRIPLKHPIVFEKG